MPINDSCDSNQILHGWEISLVYPISASDVPSSVFQYDIVKREDPPASEQISNVLVCLCPDITDAARTALLKSCSATVSYDDGSTQSLSNCFVENTIESPDINPATCKGVMFDNIPPGEGGVEQTHIFLSLAFTKALPVGPINIGFKTDSSTLSGVFEGICGPICVPVIPTTRGIML